MSLRFPYQTIPVGHSVVPLGGRWVRPRPIVAVSIFGPMSSRVRDAILDTAADDTVFRETLAMQIGLDLSKAPTGVGSGVGMGNIPLRIPQIPA